MKLTRLLFPLGCLFFIAACGEPPSLGYAPTAGAETPVKVNCRVLLGANGQNTDFSLEAQLFETPESPVGDSVVPVRYRFGPFRYYAELPGQPALTYDSRAGGDTTGTLGGLARLEGRSFALQLRRDATVAKAERPADSLSGFDWLAPEITEALLDLNAVLPNGRVKQGDQWSSLVKTEVQGLRLEIPLTWRCDQVLRDKALLSFHGVSLPPSASEAYSAGSGTDVVAQGGRRGTATVELSTGRTLQLDAVDDLKVSLSLGGTNIRYTLGRQFSVGR